ncbi:glycosyltransferase [Psychroflexus sp. ALD_RP9]|uniref:glycosyltransferase n=1 Tax=Psychroflexus sp. ALD_RP9 TaxID=2777186 RepID=UPI001A8DFBA5|nr:glycosyltransferase [Psychroflexus sp. ALD_RP9]QSS98171.1 glycosyltransferase [Psychroflexus sp. ALD_RP9]
MTKKNTPSNIALVTPLKDEINNIDSFLESIKRQSIPIKTLVIVENDSTDGSKEYLNNINEIKNIEQFKVININFKDTTYRVGKKYATIVNTGFQSLKKESFYNELDYIGILDCDVFPEKDYYKKLTSFLINNPKVGITSGLIYTETGKQHIANQNWVRGGCRIWKKKCFDEVGYQIAYTADTVSVALAHLKGWKTKTVKSASVTSREVDTRFSNSSEKGYHAYYRGHTLFYMLLKSFYIIFIKRKVKTGTTLLFGFIKSMFTKRPRIEDRQLRKYFRYYMFNKLIKKY